VIFEPIPVGDLFLASAYAGHASEEAERSVPHLVDFATAVLELDLDRGLIAGAHEAYDRSVAKALAEGVGDLVAYAVCHWLSISGLSVLLHVFDSFLTTSSRTLPHGP